MSINSLFDSQIVSRKENHTNNNNEDNYFVL